MSDPTFLVLASGFGITLLISVSCILIRHLNRPAGDLPPTLPPGNVATWFFRPLDLIGPLLLWFFWGSQVLLQALLPQNQAVEISSLALLLNFAIQGGLVLVVVALCLRNCNLHQWLGWKWRQWPIGLAIAPAAVLSMWAFFSLLDYAGYIKWMESLGLQIEQDTVLLLKNSKDPVLLGLMALTAVVVAPVCEELVFRGYLYPILKKYAGFVPAVIASSLFFSLAHGQVATILPLFVLGALLALLYEKTGSIWMPISIHFCFNGATVVLQLLARVFDLPIPTER